MAGFIGTRIQTTGAFKMMTLFVVNGCADPKDPRETIGSFDGLASEVHRVARLEEINGTDRLDWYGVVYDDERIDEQLNEGLKVFLEYTKADALVLFKTDGNKKGSRSPRIFRRHITLKDGSLMPEEQDVTFETVLNGWIHDIG